MKRSLSQILVLALLTSNAFGDYAGVGEENGTNEYQPRDDIAPQEQSSASASTNTPASSEGTSSRSSNRQNSKRHYGEDCAEKLHESRIALKNANKAPTLPANAQIIQKETTNLTSPMMVRCRRFELAAEANSESLSSDPDQVVSQDRRIACVKKGGYTLDWKSCKSGVDAYNMIVVADKALDLTQQVRAQQSSQKLSQQVAQRSADGDAQNAALDATIQNNKNLANMNKEKAAAYTLALGLLGTKIASWQGKSTGAIQKLCAKVDRDSKKKQPEDNLPSSQCTPGVDSVKGSGEIFANESGKAGLVAAFMEYMSKAVAAGLAAKNLDNIAKQVEQVKQGTEAESPAMFERCAVTPNDPSCSQGGAPVAGPEYTGGDFSIGEGIGNNVFGPETSPTDQVGIEESAALPDSVKVGDASSPFRDEAKQANKILDPAAAANAQPGSAPSGGGGGGGAGGGGGGGVSLGNDLQGPEADKEASVKTAKSDGNYNFAGGGGFKAVKDSKEDANPFASLFDSKSSGGLEEDRSIAADDIGGKDSGLFMRISRSYDKAVKNKRVEALNLE